MRRLAGVLVVIELQTCLAAVGSARPARFAREPAPTLIPACPYSTPNEDVRLTP